MPYFPSSHNYVRIQVWKLGSAPKALKYIFVFCQFGGKKIGIQLKLRNRNNLYWGREEANFIVVSFEVVSAFREETEQPQGIKPSCSVIKDENNESEHIVSFSPCHTAATWWPGRIGNGTQHISRRPRRTIELNIDAILVLAHELYTYTINPRIH